MSLLIRICSLLFIGNRVRNRRTGLVVFIQIRRNVAKIKTRTSNVRVYIVTGS